MRATKPRAAAGVAIGLLALVVVAADVYVIATRSRSTAVSHESALDQYRSPDARQGDLPLASVTSTTSLPAQSSGIPPEAVSKGAATTVPASTPNGPGTNTVVATMENQNGGDQPNSVLAGEWGTPTPGVYTYETSGFASLGVAGAQNTFPDESYAIVRRHEDCRWSLEHPVIREHVDTYEFCANGLELRWNQWTLERSFLGVTKRWTYACTGDPILIRGAAPGAQRRLSCSTTEGNSADVIATDRGVETLAIGGEGIEAHHLHIEAEMRGNFEGNVTVDIWLSADGMRVKEDRHVNGKVFRRDYTEELHVLVASLEPSE